MPSLCACSPVKDLCPSQVHSSVSSRMNKGSMSLQRIGSWNVISLPDSEDPIETARQSRYCILWAATRSGFLGFVKAGKFTVPSAQACTKVQRQCTSTCKTQQMTVSPTHGWSCIRARLTPSTRELTHTRTWGLEAMGTALWSVYTLHYTKVPGPSPDLLFMTPTHSSNQISIYRQHWVTLGIVILQWVQLPHWHYHYRSEGQYRGLDSGTRTLEEQQCFTGLRT